MNEQWISLFVTLLLVIDPIGVAALFASLTHGGTPAYRRRMALKGTAIGAGMLLLFALVGDALLRTLGIAMPTFRIAGGVLLFLVAIDMILSRPSGLRAGALREQEAGEFRDDISVFPLAFPLLAGPGALTTVLLNATATHRLEVVAALVIVLGLSLLGLLAAPRVLRLLGETGASIVHRLLGVLLAALAAQLVVDGIRASFDLRS